MERSLGRQLDERQRLRGPEVDRAAALGAEGFAVEDDVELSPSMVISSASSKCTPRTFDRPSLPREARGEGAEHRRRPLLDREQLSEPSRRPPRSLGQQQLLERGHREQRETARSAAPSSCIDTLSGCGSGGRKLAFEPQEQLQ